MKTFLVIAAFFPFFIPGLALSLDVNQTTDMLLHRWVPWREKIKLIDAISEAGSQNVLNTLITIYNDVTLNSACPAILYHTVNGLKYFEGDERAIETVRQGIHHREPEVRWISLEVLGRIGSAEDIAYLEPFLKSTSYFESNTAQLAIKDILKRTGQALASGSKRIDQKENPGQTPGY